VEAAAVIAACDDCLRRTDLVAAIAGRLDVEWRRREAPAGVLALEDEALVELGEAPARHRYAGFDAAGARARIEALGLSAICRCAPEYPARLRELPDPPAVLHVLGGVEALAEVVAVSVVGARRASPYGLEVARSLGRGLSAAGVPVVSGLALGIDAAAHAGALAAAGPTIAVMAGAAEIAYPARHRLLHEQVAERGCVVSEMPPGFVPHRWCFVARNRIVAALGAVAVIVEATERSGSLTTADFAADLGRAVTAVPGRVTSPLAAGTNGLIQAGAELVRGPEDVLDVLAEATGTRRTALAEDRRAGLAEPLRELLAAVEEGRGTLGALATTAEEARAVLAGLSELEFRGLVRRSFDGHYERAL
jgi:DNA processing protein